MRTIEVMYRPHVSDQLRRAVETAPVSRYQIAREAGV